MLRPIHNFVNPPNHIDSCSVGAGEPVGRALRCDYSSAANFSMSPSVPVTMMRSWFETTVCSVA
jgi:hypothetical protein